MKIHEPISTVLDMDRIRGIRGGANIYEQRVPSRERPMSFNETGCINSKAYFTSQHSLLPQSTSTLFPYPQDDLYQELPPTPTSTVKRQVVSAVRVAVLIVAIIVLTFAVSLLTMWLVNPFKELHCVPCQSLRLSSDPYDDFRSYFRIVEGAVGEDNQCCADTTEQLQILMDVMVKRGVREENANGPMVAALTSLQLEDDGNSTDSDNVTSSDGSGSSPVHHVIMSTTNMYSAHVFLGDTGNRDEVDSGYDYETIRGWTDAPDSAFIRRGVIYNERTGRFIITRKGTYMIYAHLAYLAPSNTHQPQQHTPEVETVYYAHKLLREKKYGRIHHQKQLSIDVEARICDMNYRTIPCYSANMAAQHRLRQGDEVYIQTLHRDLLIDDREKSYFGIYMVT